MKYKYTEVYWNICYLWKKSSCKYKSIPILPYIIVAFVSLILDQFFQDVENAENHQVKRFALQTLSNDVMNKQDRLPASFRFSKQPLSIQQRKCQEAQANIFNIEKPFNNMVKRQPLTDNSTNVIENKNTTSQKLVFQSLMPQKVSVDSGASFVRVQNSQVRYVIYFVE